MLYVVQSPAYTEFRVASQANPRGAAEVLPDYAVPTLIEPVMPCREPPRTSQNGAACPAACAAVRETSRCSPPRPLQRSDLRRGQIARRTATQVLGIVRRKVRAPLELEDSWLEFGGNS